MSTSSITEKQVKDRVKRSLKEHGAYWFMPVQSGYGAAGLDFHGCHKGRAFAIETKKPGKKLTPRQKLTKMEMEEAGMKVFIIGEHITSDPAELITIVSGLTDLEVWLLGLTS